MTVSMYKKRFDRVHLLSDDTLTKHQENAIKYNVEHPEKGKKHSDFMKQRWKNPTYRRTQTQCVRQYFDDPKVCEVHGEKISMYFRNHPEACEERSRVAIERWKEPEYRKWYSEVLKVWHRNNPEIGENTSKRMRMLWCDDDYRKWYSEMMVEWYRMNPEHREKLSRVMTERNLKDWQNPERRENHSKFMLNWHEENPENREASSERMIKWTSEHPEVIENLTTWRKEHPDFMRGEKHWNWKGGHVESRKRREMKRREMGYCPLFDNPFPSDIEVDCHHVNDMIVVPVPHTVHNMACAAGINTPEHRERCNLWMYYLYGVDFDLLLRS